MRKTPKKVWIAVAGVALAGVLMTGTFLYKDYENKTSQSVCNFVPPPCFRGMVEAVDIKNGQMTVTMDEKSLVLDCEKDAYKLYNTKPGDTVNFRCEEEKLEDELVEIWHFDREEE